MPDKDHIQPLDETDLYVLFKRHEDVYLFEKETSKELWLVCIHGEASCGKIALSNEWAVIGGDNLYIWTGKVVKEINDEALMWTEQIRQTGDHEVELLIDPWSEKSAIWRFDLKSFEKTKIRDFNDYRNKEYTDNIIW